MPFTLAPSNDTGRVRFPLNNEKLFEAWLFTTIRTTLQVGGQVVKRFDRGLRTCLNAAGITYDEGSGAPTDEPIQRAAPAAASKYLDVLRENWKSCCYLPAEADVPS